MKRRLPARPNLEHLRTQAKTLLTKLRDGDSEAAQTLIEHLPEASGLSPEEVRKHAFRLADAQAAIARKSGFAAWPGLTRHVDRLRSMEGTWGFHSLEVDGSAMPQLMFSSSRLLIDGDRFRMESPEANYEGIFIIDVEQSPNHIDIDFVEGPEAGNRSQGIFQLEGNRFTICLGFAGAQRPKRFATSRGSGHALEELVRMEHTRPPGVDGGTWQAPAPALSPLIADTKFEAAVTPMLRKLTGEWAPLEIVTSGKPLEAAYLPYGFRSNSGGETKVIFGGQTMLHAKIRFNEAATPIEVDYLHLAGKGKGSISHGLFRWDGEEAVYCMAAPGAPRPCDFSCDPGSDRIYSRWKRKM